jgi:(1->4)-alpha-D-glucan 1-alpha-D-glucosylmutase
MVAFPVYRTYVDARHFTEEDRAILTKAFEEARDRCPECRPGVDQLIDLLLSALQKGPESPSLRARQHFLMRFQQFTGPAMAKGFEDTLLYVYNRFLSLNEVGGDPNTFGVPLEDFHRFYQSRARNCCERQRQGVLCTPISEADGMPVGTAHPTHSQPLFRTGGSSSS